MNDKTLKGLSMFASKDLIRPIMMGVNFTETYAEATDGYKMAWVSYPKDTPHPKGIVPAFDIQEAIKLKGKSDNPLVYKDNTIIAGETIKKYHPIEGTYPDTKKLISQVEGKGIRSVRLGVKLLSEVLNALKSADKQFIDISIVDDDKESSEMPVLFVADDIKGLIMPVRVREK